MASTQDEAELQEFKQQLLVVEQTLEESPDSVELFDLREQLKALIAALEPAVASQSPPQPTSHKSSPSPQPEKWSKANHPAFQPGYKKPGTPQTPSDEPQISFKVNDMVQARWRKDFYPAVIRSITGSAAAPIYLVKYQGFPDTANLRAHDIKPMDNKKRKIETTQPSSSGVNTPAASYASASTSTISAAPSVNLGLINQPKKEPMMATDGPPRPPKQPKKVKANKELEAKKNSWSAFQNAGKTGKSGKKDSMFRTGNSVNARVGFTGSGQNMRKDPSKARHTYETGEEEY